MEEVVTQSAFHLYIQYGVLALAVIVFALVIRALYKQGREDAKAFAEERKTIAAENAERVAKLEAELASARASCRADKEALRADNEKRYKEALEGYTTQLRQVRVDYDARIAEIKRDSETLIAKVSQSAESANEMLVEMLQKFYDKIAR